MHKKQLSGQSPVIHDDAFTDKTAENCDEGSNQEKYTNLIGPYYQEETTFRQPKKR